jgi:hypothetical protein
VLAAEYPQGVDVVYEGVGGALRAAIMQHLAPNARVLQVSRVYSLRVPVVRGGAGLSQCMPTKCQAGLTLCQTWGAGSCVIKQSTPGRNTFVDGWLLLCCCCCRWGTYLSTLTLGGRCLQQRAACQWTSCFGVASVWSWTRARRCLDRSGPRCVGAPLPQIWQAGATECTYAGVCAVV